MTARILIFKDTDGKPYYLPHTDPPIPMREVAEQIVRNFPIYPQEIPLFANHQWGKAYGWVKSLELKDDGLWATIEPTEEGLQLIQSEAYKYVSPGLSYGITLPTGETIQGWVLTEVSLTNMPAQFGAAIIQLMQNAPRLTLQSEHWVANNDPFDYPIDTESNWDADASETRFRNFVSEKDPSEWTETEWRKYRRRFLVYNRADPNKLSSYKLPVVDIINGKPHLVRRALIAAKAALSGARGGVNLPQNLKQTLLNKINQTLEEINMTREELTQTILELLNPIQQRLEQIEAQLQAQNQHQQQLLLERTASEIEAQITSWRFGNDNNEAIPPQLAKSFALLLARLPEPERNEALTLLRHNPPATIPLNPTAYNNPSTPYNSISPIQAKYMQQLGIDPETFLKYNSSER
jgi:hypothetical protein